MDLTCQYCPERRTLERCNWGLVSKLALFTEQLMKLIGKDHWEFMATRTRCENMKHEILESRARLCAHRAAHGC